VTTRVERKRTARKGRLKIGEVARQADVPTSVITFYLSQGLLPKPVKTSRNMAYYDEATVERVRLIRELTQNAFLPLRVVKKVLSSGATPQEIRASFAGRLSRMAPAGGEVEESALATGGRLSKAELRRLAALGVLSPRRKGEHAWYSADDAVIVAELTRMRKAGLTPERGYSVEHMALYRDAVEALAEKEIELGIEGLVGSMSPGELAEVAAEWVESANQMLAALHRKTLKRLLAGLSARMKDG
jgi:DNA-binding transcriptional MerR regulator